MVESLGIGNAKGRYPVLALLFQSCGLVGRRRCGADCVERITTKLQGVKKRNKSSDMLSKLQILSAMEGASGLLLRTSRAPHRGGSIASYDPLPSGLSPASPWLLWRRKVPCKPWRAHSVSVKPAANQHTARCISYNERTAPLSYIATNRPEM